MFWRTVITGVVLFWAVMSGLLIRNVYFPGHSRFAEVPVSRVLDLFLAGPAAFSNTLHILHEGQKLGQVNFNVRKSQEREEAPVYGLLITGSMDPPVLKKDASDDRQAAFRFSAELDHSGQWRSMKGALEVPSADLTARLNWKQGPEPPAIEVIQAGRVTLNSAMASGLLGQSIGPADAGFAAQDSLLPHLSAREGEMQLAGRKRRCFVVTARVQAFQGGEAQLYFTEVGELARVELPGGWRLIEPMMHSLDP